MSKAIGIRVKKADDGYDLGASKFFGTPTVPEAWETDFSDTALFFCQLRLADIAALDTENRLPHRIPVRVPRYCGRSVSAEGRCAVFPG